MVMEGKDQNQAGAQPDLHAGKTQEHRAQSLGLRKLNQVVERPDTPGFRGMVKKVPHLLDDRQGIAQGRINMNLSNLTPPKGQKHKKQRIGHGMGSGHGKTSGRGAQGRASRSPATADARLRRRPDAAAPPSAEARLHQHFQEGIRHRQSGRAGKAGRRHVSRRIA